MGPYPVRQCYTLLRGPVRRAVKDQIIPDPLIDIRLPAKPTIRRASTTCCPQRRFAGSMHAS